MFMMMMLMTNFYLGDVSIKPSGGSSISTYLFGGGLALLIVGWAALRYWLTVSGKSKHDEVSTPTIDRLNVQALNQITEQNQLPLVSADEPAPDDLLAVVPKDAPMQKAPAKLPVVPPNPNDGGK